MEFHWEYNTATDEWDCREKEKADQLHLVGYISDWNNVYTAYLWNEDESDWDEVYKGPDFQIAQKTVEDSHQKSLT